MTLNHAHFGTRNMAAFRRFYERYFDFERKFESGATLFLGNPAGFLLAVDVVEELPAFPEWYHLGFLQPSEAEVFRLHDLMKQNGENIVRAMITSPNEFASYFVKDPDGNKLEVSWHAE